jgi:hypothetical protein
VHFEGAAVLRGTYGSTAYNQALRRATDEGQFAASFLINGKRVKRHAAFRLVLVHTKAPVKADTFAADCFMHFELNTLSSTTLFNAALCNTLLNQFYHAEKAKLYEAFYERYKRVSTAELRAEKVLTALAKIEVLETDTWQELRKSIDEGGMQNKTIASKPLISPR